MTRTRRPAPQANPIITVAVCTFNRGNILLECLDGIANQSVDSEKIELLIIDNNSTDNTAQIVNDFRANFPNLKYVFEEEQGLSKARNRAIKESTTPILVFIDDDAIPYTDWIERFIEAFERFPEASVIGGESEPMFESERPDWLDDELLKSYSCGLLYSTDYHFLVGKEWLVECNLAYRVDALKAAGGFPESLGRKGNLLLSGDGSVNLLIAHAGGRLLYTPFAKVRHLVPTHRMTTKWLAQRRFWGGVTASLENEYLKSEIGKVEPWRDLFLPSRITEWESVVNLEPDENLKSNLTRISHLGYLLAKAGMIAP